MGSICLNMIVKNESEIIERCLESIAPFIDSWLISDTGSEDGTQEIIKAFFNKKAIPGKLIENPWQDFSTNRNLALEAAQSECNADYILLMDADDYLQCEDGFSFKNLKADVYLLNIQRGGINYAFPKLIKAKLPWRWKGVLHENIECDLAEAAVLYPGKYTVVSTTEGARGSDPNKYKKDIELLKQGLQDEPNNARYQFYLAQSYRDDGDYMSAHKHYLNRVEMAGWEEEVYYSLLEAARCQRKLHHPTANVLDSFIKAHHYRPSRLEALCEAMSLCRTSQLYHLGYQLGVSIKAVKLPSDILFVDHSVYQWRFFDELSICAIYAGEKQYAASLIKALLKSTDLPGSERGRIENNLSFT